MNIAEAQARICQFIALYPKAEHGPARTVLHDWDVRPETLKAAQDVTVLAVARAANLKEHRMHAMTSVLLTELRRGLYPDS